MVWWRDSCLSIVPLFSKHQILMKCKLNTAATSLTARLVFLSTLSPPMKGCNENWSHHTKNVFTSGLAWHESAAFKGTTHIWGTCYQSNRKLKIVSFLGIWSYRVELSGVLAYSLAQRLKKQLVILCPTHSVVCLAQFRA